MSDNTASLNQMCHEKMAFFGAITANITHELNNVLAIIEQSSGLLEDLTYVAKKGESIPPDKLFSVTEKTTKHSQRGFELIRNLNRFAHSVDEPVKQFDLCEIVSNFHALTVRFANLKQVEYHKNISSGRLKVETDEFEFQRVLFLILKFFLKNIRTGDIMQIGCEEENRKACVWLQIYNETKLNSHHIDEVLIKSNCDELGLICNFEIESSSLEVQITLDIIPEED